MHFFAKCNIVNKIITFHCILCSIFSNFVLYQNLWYQPHIFTQHKCKDTTFMTISFNFEPIILILLGISLFIALIFILWEYLNLHSLKNCIKNSKSLNNNNREGVSVIIYADNDTENLSRNLNKFLSQEYPLYEIIIVNDGANEATNSLLEDMVGKTPNLRVTYTPNDARNLSRKKLAVMVGIKAAQYDIIITTNGNCVPVSNRWIESIAQHFNNGADIVIGHIQQQLSSRFNQHIYHYDTIKYLCHALRHKPYRGTSENLAYRKSLFFKNKGFSRSMHLHFGDDDLFINEIATRHNTSVEISHESLIQILQPNPDHEFSITHLRRKFTERMINSAAFPLFAIKSLLPLISSSTLIAAIALSYTNIVVYGFALLLLILTTTTHLHIYHRTGNLLKTSRANALVPFYTFAQPFFSLYYSIKSRQHTTYNYTWRPLHK